MSEADSEGKMRIEDRDLVEHRDTPDCTWEANTLHSLFKKRITLSGEVQQ